MAKRARTADMVEPDRMEGFAHPRETTRLIGQDEGLARAARAIRAGRPPQAWLITGPPGVGKATLAYRVARYLLAFGATADGPADLSTPEGARAAIQVANGSHPGLLALKRGLNKDGKLMNVLGVDEIRRLGQFFGMTSGAGGWRVVIVDTSDDMSDNAANALLKLLEEPPPQSMLLLIANAPGRLLPTIRSRCQRLDLKPLPAEVVEGELERQVPNLSAGERKSISRLSGGSLGMALHLASGEGVALASEADALIERAENPDIPALLSFADRISRSSDGFGDFSTLLSQALADRILKCARTNAPRLDRWVETWERLNVSFDRTSALYLDPRQTLLGAQRALSKATARAGRI
ncbi:MAG TPA: DNA polymerase III subunit delta' [Rhizomicrobium sp.]|nr:DNA polymerase III subunit delta' [Rhizomicrobium sp.]